jgi:hypothetical protein
VRLAAFLLVLAVSPLAHAGDVKSFLSDYCLDCHDHRTKKGGFSMEELGAVTAPEYSQQWLKILQQLERQNMPPADEDQPTAELRRSTMLAVEDGLVSGARNRAEHRPAVLRRLTRIEYRNTLRDLLCLNENSSDPTHGFPDDTRSHGFQSNGEKLVTSNFLLRHYVEAAEQTVAEAIHFEPQPETKHWDLSPPFDRTQFYFTGAEANYYRKVAKTPQPYQTIVECMRDMPMMGFHPIDELRDGVAVSGWYSIRILAEAKFHDAELDPKDPALDLRKQKFPSMWNPAEPIRLSLSTATLAGVDPNNKAARDYAATHYQAGERDLAIWDLPNDQLTWVECRMWLNRGEFPRLGFPNGPSDSNNRVSNFFRSNKERLLTKEQLENYEKDRLLSGDSNVWMWFESPRIHISKIEIAGPLNDVWPPASHRVVFGDGPYRSDAAGEVLQKFATRAWRRPAGAEEVAPIVNLVRASEKNGLSAEAAIQEGLKAILCSPEFIYREEKGGELSDYELASRLSYFLTSSMPDERLLQRAAVGELKRPEVLREEALRMLAGSNSNAFIEAMMTGWLAMYKLGSMAPDVRKFSFYYDDHLEPAMKTETRLFFRQLLRTNAPIDRFLSCDYTFVNRQLAKLYGIDTKVYEKALGQDVEGLDVRDLVPDADGHAPSIGFAKVKLTDPRRGGLLGQASVLTLSANGVDTSPVIRGVWILDNILGAPPSPPPPNVPTIEPDARGTKTIRDRLEKHRASATCYACHHQIDPPGFALEEFDAVGRLRTSYVDGNNKSLPLDSGGQFGPAKFTDVSGFKAALLNHREQFARCLVEKLLMHALGRDLEITDRPAIRQIVETAAKDNYRLQDLVLLCVQSDIFRTK